MNIIIIYKNFEVYATEFYKHRQRSESGKRNGNYKSHPNSITCIILLFNMRQTAQHFHQMKRKTRLVGIQCGYQINSAKVTYTLCLRNFIIIVVCDWSFSSSNKLFLIRVDFNFEIFYVCLLFKMAFSINILLFLFYLSVIFVFQINAFFIFIDLKWFFESTITVTAL